MKLIDNSGDFAKGGLICTWLAMMVFIAITEYWGWAR